MRYLNRTLRAEPVPATTAPRASGLVTPLRDGMNLVAKEYVAAQDPDDPGVLVLSRFAGAAEILHGRLLVNPYDVYGVAAAIEQALTMKLAERQERHRPTTGGGARQRHPGLAQTLRGGLGRGHGMA